MADNDEAPAKVVIGISFGNSNSSIAWTSGDGKPEVIANEEGDRQIPSALSYVQGEEVHGTQAKTQLVKNPTNTVICFRDFLGKDFKSIDPTNCHASAHPIEAGNTVAFSIHDTATEADGPHTRSVEEITTRHLRRLQASAADYLGKPINAAVVTVPTDFADIQKKALVNAAKATELDILQFIPEPIAALLAYDARDSHAASKKDRIVVVGDFGATRSDVAVVASRGGMYTILATEHDYETAGAQLDQVLVDYAAKEFMKKNKIDPRQNERALAKLKLEAEALKKSLSIGSSAAFSIEMLVDGVDFGLTVNRSRYELLGAKIFASLTRLVEAALEKASLDKLDVNEIILSGGLSYTPKLAHNIQAAFPNSVKIFAPALLSDAIHPSDLSARGAAVQASLIAEFDKEDIEQSVHPAVTVTPHLQQAIGVVGQSPDGTETFVPLIEADTAVPVRRTAHISANEAGGDVLVKLCEGASEIKISRPAPKPATNGVTKGKESDDEDEDEEEEEEDVRVKIWKVGTILAEVGVRNVKPGGQIEIQVSVDAGMEVQVTAREVGGKGGVRGTIKA